MDHDQANAAFTPAWWTLMLLRGHRRVPASSPQRCSPARSASYVPVTLTVGPIRSGDGDQREGQDARRRRSAGSASIGTGQGGARSDAGDRPRPDPVHPGQRRGADPGHHRVRRQVRRPGLPRQTRAPSGWPPARCCSRSNVTTEVNTVFENVVDLLDQIDPAKLNAVLTALADGGPRPGRADRPGHHRPQPGAAGAQRPQRDHPRRTGARSRASTTPSAAAAATS